MTSPFYRPTNPFVSPASPAAPSAFSGSKELSYAGLSAAVESGDGALSAHSVAHSAAIKASTEAVALAKSMSLAQASIGNAAILHPVSMQAAAAASAEVSPIVQLIMKLPGALGLTSSFFEWLQHLFAPGAHDLLSTLEGGLHLDLAGHAAALEHVLNLSGLTEHFTVSLNNLPTDAPILHGLKDAGIKASDSLLTGRLPAGDHFMQDPANLGAGPDLANAQFEHAVPQADGALAGPGLSQHGGNMVLSGNQRLFSDNMSSGQFSSMVSNTSTPAAVPNTGLNSSGISMPEPQTAYQAAESGIPSQAAGHTSLLTGTTGDAGPGGSILTGTAHDATSGGSLLTGTTGGAFNQGGSLLTGKDTLIASDVPSLNPSSGGYFQTTQNAPAADITPLKAKPLTFADLHKGSRAGSHGIIDHVGHQAKGGHFGTAHHDTVDGIAHHNLAHRSYIASKPDATEMTSPSASHPVPNVAHEVHRAAPQRSLDSQLHVHHKPAMHFSKSLRSALGHQDQLKVASMGNKVSQYSVQKGDSLWGIAQKKLGEGARWSDIYRMNSDVIGSNPNLIFSGTHLKLPEFAGQMAKYVVKPGDNLWTIAKNQLGDPTRWQEIYRANSLVIGDSGRLILPGQQLSLPGASPSVAQAAASGTVAAVPGTEASMMSTNDAIAPSQAFGTPAAGSDAVAGTTSGGMAAQFNGQGSGAAAAAGLNQQGTPLVSSRLAPDLSFLKKTN